jgi:hypothetical protein
MSVFGEVDIGALAPKKAVRIVTHQSASEIVVLTALQHCSKQKKAPDQQARRKGPKPQGAS